MSQYVFDLQDFLNQVRETYDNDPDVPTRVKQTQDPVFQRILSGINGITSTMERPISQQKEEKTLSPAQREKEILSQRQ